MIRETLTLLAAVTVVGIVTTVAVAAIRKKRAPSGDPGVWVYNVSPDGGKFAAAIAPDEGDNWAWKFVGRTYDTLEEARIAALDAIATAGGTAKEFVA